MQQIFQNLLTFAFCDVILFDKHELNVCIFERTAVRAGSLTTEYADFP